MDVESLVAEDASSKIQCRFCWQLLPITDFYESRLKKKHIICKKCFKHSSSNCWQKVKQQIDNNIARYCATCKKELDSKKLTNRCKPCMYEEVKKRRNKVVESDKQGVERICTVCGKVKKGLGPDGFTNGLSACSKCTSHDVKRRKYKLSKAELKSLMQIQNCQICQRSFGTKGKKCIDHCHSSKKVRGVLCTQCNAGIGMFQDNINNLESAIRYLLMSGDAMLKPPQIGSSGSNAYG